jgi:hypothetical protein
MRTDSLMLFLVISCNLIYNIHVCVIRLKCWCWTLDNEDSAGFQISEWDLVQVKGPSPQPTTQRIGTHVKIFWESIDYKSQLGPHHCQGFLVDLSYPTFGSHSLCGYYWRDSTRPSSRHTCVCQTGFWILSFKRIVNQENIGNTENYIKIFISKTCQIRISTNLNYL